ncbi:unnamed protein product [Acanthoscelides obtectus]|uniref:Uncharacterized protein n=1 Tax=Acanthoscelides obtectus TaxID=200917 RepID=A0A9P0LGS4_ACAOB|nr:unnamed protein product [Acanthoscelides obtectus]CAK1655325.1 hypothetical protein AOBTE_LOCUS19139 [Acanthoscelides obtectus]
MWLKFVGISISLYNYNNIYRCDTRSVGTRSTFMRQTLCASKLHRQRSRSGVIVSWLALMA